MFYIIFIFYDCAKFFAYKHKSIPDLKVFSIILESNFSFKIILEFFKIILESVGTTVQDYFLCIDFLKAGA